LHARSPEIFPGFRNQFVRTKRDDRDTFGPKCPAVFRISVSVIMIENQLEPDTIIGSAWNLENFTPILFHVAATRHMRVRS